MAEDGFGDADPGPVVGRGGEGGDEGVEAGLTLSEGAEGADRRSGFGGEGLQLRFVGLGGVVGVRRGHQCEDTTPHSRINGGARNDHDFAHERGSCNGLDELAK